MEKRHGVFFPPPRKDSNLAVHSSRWHAVRLPAFSSSTTMSCRLRILRCKSLAIPLPFPSSRNPDHAFSSHPTPRPSMNQDIDGCRARADDATTTHEPEHPRAPTLPSTLSGALTGTHKKTQTCPAHPIITRRSSLQQTRLAMPGSVVRTACSYLYILYARKRLLVLLPNP